MRNAERCSPTPPSDAGTSERETKCAKCLGTGWITHHGPSTTRFSECDCAAAPREAFGYCDAHGGVGRDLLHRMIPDCDGFQIHAEPAATRNEARVLTDWCIAMEVLAENGRLSSRDRTTAVQEISQMRALAARLASPSPTGAP